MIDRVFLEHPRQVGESYLQHMRQALTFSVLLLTAGAVCAFHAIVPCLFQATGSRIIARLYERMARRRRHPAPYGRTMDEFDYVI